MTKKHRANAERVQCGWRLNPALIREIRRLAAERKQTMVVVAESILERGMRA